MKKLISLIFSLMFVSAANGTLLTVDFNDIAYDIGDRVAVNIVISDIESDNSGFQKLLGAFNLNLTFSDTVSFVNVVFGNQVSTNPGLVASVGNQVSLNQANLTFLPGEVDLRNQLSLSSFVLATVNFNVESVGINQFSLTNPQLFTGGFFPQAFTNVRVSSVPVPAPSVFALFLVAGLALVARKKHR